MKVIVFGATGMVGQGVLRECLLDPGVDQVLSIGRRRTGASHPKLRELVHQDFTDFTPVEDRFAGYDACFFCLGVSSAGLDEAQYRRVTYDFAMAAARALVARSPGMTFVFVSGSGTDSTERGRWMWARVKGQTENALARLPFKATFMFRPGLIQPRHGIQSSTRWTRVLYKLLGPLVTALRRLLPGLVTDTEELGRAMIAVARRGSPLHIIENAALPALAAAAPGPPPAAGG